jgi:hypothetical protein
MSKEEQLRSVAAIERVHECMKLGLGRNAERYDEELAELVDEFGADFVAHQACEEARFGGKECPLGYCERPEGYGLPGEEITCREACLAYIESFIGVRCAN